MGNWQKEYIKIFSSFFVGWLAAILLQFPASVTHRYSQLISSAVPQMYRYLLSLESCCIVIPDESIDLTFETFRKLLPSRNYYAPHHAPHLTITVWASPDPLVIRRVRFALWHTNVPGLRVLFPLTQKCQCKLLAFLDFLTVKN